MGHTKVPKSMFFRNILPSDVTRMAVDTVWNPMWQPIYNPSENAYYCFKT